MFVVNEDNSIYATRGDIVFFSVSAEDRETETKYTFKAGDVLRIKVYGKKDAEKVVLQKDFPVLNNTSEVEIYLTEEDTKIGEVISKPVDYWYEVELNPDEAPQTIVGYNEDGAVLFKLFPEGADIESYEPDPEDFPVVDEELDMSSPRPVSNKAIAKAFVNLEEGYEKCFDAVSKLHVTPQMFGAVGDGVADDTEAIQAAIDSGNNVVFPEGTYSFANSLSLTDKADCQLDATNATLLYTGSEFAIVANKLQEATLNLGQIVAPNGSGIKFLCENEDDYTQYVDVYFRAIKAKDYCVYADITGGWVNEVRFHNGVFTGCEYGCYLLSSATDECTAWKFFNVSFEGCRTGLYLGGNCRFRNIDMRSIRYGDDTCMVVVHVANQVHNLKIDASMPFYNSYFVIDDGKVVYNSDIAAPIYNDNHVLVCRHRYFDASGVAHDVGFVERNTQELFNDCVHATVTKHANVKLSDTYCAYNAVVATFQTKVTCNAEVPAWVAVVTLPKEAMRVVGSCVHTYVPALNSFVQLYVNTDGTITSAVNLPSGAEFTINFTAIRNQ